MPPLGRDTAHSDGDTDVVSLRQKVKAGDSYGGDSRGGEVHISRNRLLRSVM